jgi:hypothetical protein
MSKSFRTEITLNQYPFNIQHDEKVMLIGSCFSDNIGAELTRLKFPVLQNPFGVLYNPKSIAGNLDAAITNQQEQHDRIFHHNYKWHSFNFHGSFSSENKNDLLNNISDRISQTHKFLKEATFLFVTFGTAWIFEDIKDQKIVANCHKLPAKSFKRRRLGIEEIVNDWNSLIQEIKKFNSNIKIIFTVSPVRHLKDGLHENQISKATLLLAIEEIIAKHSQTFYFPSYEIIHDDLRDYRFYSEDMTHISKEGIQYIYEKFSEAFWDKQTMNTINEIMAIVKASEHRPMNSGKELIKFAESMLNKINKIEKKYSYIKFELEKKYFKNLYSPD